MKEEEGESPLDSFFGGYKDKARELSLGPNESSDVVTYFTY